jgi:putative membrane protein
MKFINTLLKGMAIGVSNVIPGISAGTLMVLLGIYDELVEAIGNILTNKSKRKDYFLFLSPLAMGAVGGVLLFASLITLVIERYAAPTQFFFIGLVLGSIPAVLSMHHEMKPSITRLAAFVVGLGLVAFMDVEERLGISAHISAGTSSLLGFLLFAVVGFLAGGTMVTPGVSGAYVFLLTETYEPIMQALASLTQPPIHWGVIISVAAGAAIGLLVCSRLIDLAFERQPAVTYYTILGLICGSFVGLWPAGLDLFVSSLASMLALIPGVAIAYLLGRSAKSRAPRSHVVGKEMV